MVGLMEVIGSVQLLPDLSIVELETRILLEAPEIGGDTASHKDRYRKNWDFRFQSFKLHKERAILRRDADLGGARLVIMGQGTDLLPDLPVLEAEERFVLETFEVAVDPALDFLPALSLTPENVPYLQ